MPLTSIRATSPRYAGSSISTRGRPLTFWRWRQCLLALRERQDQAAAGLGQVVQAARSPPRSARRGQSRLTFSILQARTGFGNDLATSAARSGFYTGPPENSVSPTPASICKFFDTLGKASERLIDVLGLYAQTLEISR